MKFGLSDSDFQILLNLVLEPLKKKSIKLYIFGSRATGRQHKFSDLDLLIEPPNDKPISVSELSEIKEAIEESRFPIKVDFVLMDELAESYKDRILKEKIEI